MPDYTQSILYFYNEGLKKLPNDLHLYTQLKEFSCAYNKLTQIDNLPSNIELLYCDNNKITQLDNLPHSLKVLHCQENNIT